MPTSVGSGILCETSLWRRSREAARWSAAADAPELLAHQSLPCLPPTSTSTPTSRSTTTRIACSSVLLQHIIRIILDARNVHQHEFVKDDDWHERKFSSSSFWNLTRLTLMRSAVFIPTNLVCPFKYKGASVVKFWWGAWESKRVMCNKNGEKTDKVWKCKGLDL